jgi:RHS repeat-associated protein
MEYDLLGRLTNVTDDAGGASLLTRYEYDANGNLRHQYDPLNNQVEYLYDGLNRKTGHIQYKAYGNLTTAMGYDEEGNLTSLTDAKGQTFIYAYDELNRQTTAVYPAAATPYLTIRSIETGYDANNNVKTVTETKDQAGGGTVTDSTVNTYDDFDRLKTTTERGLTITYSYDSNGNRTGVASPNGSTAYTFDNRNRLATAIAGGKTTSYTYTPDGKQKAITYPNGTSVEYGYYPTNRVETVTNKAGGTTISSYAYQYDANGNRTRQLEVQGASSETTAYSYNGLDQMTGFTVTGEKTTITSYTFEAYNRKTETVSENGTITKDRTYSYDETNWLTSIVDNGPDSRTIAYSYDNNGNTLSKSDSAKPDEDINFSYDSRNQLVRTTRGPPASQEILGSYDYNAQGLRVRHLGSERGDVAYYYDDKAVLEEHNATDDSLLAHYRYADRLLSLTTTGGSQFYHYDGLGSTVNLSDDAGEVQVSYLLDPWGNIKEQTGTSVNRQIFTGQEHDEKTGLIYFGARFYDPEVGRFINQDSYLGVPGTPPSLHRYLYAYGNPTVYIDLYGYESIEVDKENNKVYWNIQKDWIGPYNPTTRQVYIGDMNKEGQVKLTQEFGGGLVAHEQLKAAASNFWGRYNAGGVILPAHNISGESEERQNWAIRSYLEDINVRNETFLSSPDSAPTIYPMRSKYGRYDDEYGISTRAGGAGKVIAGGAGAYLTANSVVATPAAVYFADMAASGVQEVATGDSHPTLFTQGVYSASRTFGASDQTASLITQSTDVVVGTALLAGASQSTFTPNITSRVSNSGISASEGAQQQRLLNVLHQRELGLDPATKSFRAIEAQVATRLESQLGRRLSRDLSGAADWVDDIGRTYDAVGPIPSQHFNLQSVTNSIGGHLNKQGLNKVVVDLSGLSSSQASQVSRYISNLPSSQANKIMILGR